MTPAFIDESTTVHIGDCLTVLRELPAESVHCVVTSPPYWGLRDYGIPGQLGLEPTPELYVEHMVEVFREVRRGLRPDGTLWLNMGDSYAGSWSGNSMRPDGGTQRPGGPGFQPLDDRVPARSGIVPSGLKPKDLVGIPWRLAFALQADGWWLRSDIVWSKPNPMPESVIDRPTKSHEYVFLLTKNSRYFYDAEAVREPFEAWGERDGKFVNLRGGQGFGADRQAVPRPGNPVMTGNMAPGKNIVPNSAGRNLRSVWTIATQPYPEAHFATFPEKLVEPCILAGASAKGCCPECGAPWARVVETEKIATPCYATSYADAHGSDGRDALRASLAVTTTGWRPSCHCTGDGTPDRTSIGTGGREPVPCTVLDPFAGSGTTLAVARRLGRRSIGIELQAEYLPLIRQRVHWAVHQRPEGSAIEVAEGQVDLFEMLT